MGHVPLLRFNRSRVSFIIFFHSYFRGFSLLENENQCVKKCLQLTKQSIKFARKCWQTTPTVDQEDQTRGKER